METVENIRGWYCSYRGLYEPIFKRSRLHNVFWDIECDKTKLTEFQDDTRHYVARGVSDA